MKKIFIPTPLDDTVHIPEKETHHLLRVFRHNLEKPVTLTGSDNRMGIYYIKGEEEGQALAELDHYVDYTPRDYDMVLVQSILKGDKMDLVVQKSTELDVDTVYTVSTANCVAKYDAKKLKAKGDRWTKIMQEASQQCGRYDLPDLEVACSLEEILEREADSLCILAYESEDGTTLRKVLTDHPDKRRVVVFIGPEGGFGKQEVEALAAKGVHVASLGNTILRAETAAISALAMMKYELEL